MKKNIRKLLILVNAIFGIVVLWALFFPIAGTSAEYSNTDTSGDVVQLGAVTDQRSMELKFNLYGHELSGINLFFYVDGEEDSGDIICTLKYNGEEIGQETVSVRELAALASSSSLKAKKLEFKHEAVSSGEYTLLLEGQDIAAETRIALYGNKSTENFLQIEDKLQNFYTPLYLLEVSTTSHPYIWYAVFCFVLCMMTSYVIYMNYALKNKEKKLEDK